MKIKWITRKLAILKLIILTSVLLGIFVAQPHPVALASDTGVLEVCASGCAYSSIQDAIDAASDGETVLVGDGTYVENINFLGKAITVTSVNGAATTIIDGNAIDRVVTFNNGEEADSILQKFTIQNGYAINSNGGGILCSDSSPTIINCIIDDNRAAWGGGIYCTNSSPVITNCTISNNYTYTSGGGIYCCYTSSPIITNCNINDNVAKSAGGGFYIITSSSPVIDKCNISLNVCLFSYGGGICCSDSSPTITNCNIDRNNNNDKGGGRYGGGISISGESLAVITNCTVTRNRAVHWGSIDYGSGGGIYCNSSLSVTITNCTISDNYAFTWGGGIWADSNKTEVINSIICNNTNFASGGFPYREIYGPPVVTYSDILTGYAGEGNIMADPLFVGGGDYHLTADSPCINAGTDAGAPANDIDGDIRPQGGGYDMGSDEYLSGDPNDVDGDGVLNEDDNCPDNANPDQLDLDHDDIGNVCDDDRDGDGFSNEEDNCPDADNPLQNDGDNDGIGDACDEHCNPALTVKQGWVGSQSSWWLQPWGNTCDGKAQNAIDGIYKKFTYSRDYWNCTGDLSPRSFFAPRYTGQDVGEWMQIDFPEIYTINGITMTQAKERMYVSGLVRPHKHTAYLENATLIFSDGSALEVTFPAGVSSNVSFQPIATESVQIIAGSFYGTTTTNPAWFVMEIDFSGAPGDVDLNLEICHEDAPPPPDDDQDGVPDYIDEFPTDETEWIDSDDDGIGDNADPDDDNDGVPDELDTSPGEDDSGVDTDGDGITNAVDTDDDGDGVLDTEDAFPKDPTEQSDSDNDGIGDNIDNCPGQYNPDQTDTDNDGLGDACDTTDVIIRLLDSNGNGLAGGEVSWRIGTGGNWQDAGITDSEGNLVASFIEGLAPEEKANLNIRMEYNNAYNSKIQDVNTELIVEFHTNKVTLELKDSDDNPITSGVSFSYRIGTGGSWIPLSGSMIELLPLTNYNFRVSYAGTTNNQHPVDITGGSTTVTFHTNKVTLELKDCSDNPIAGGSFSYRIGTGGSWIPLFGSMIELLPLTNYNFRVTLGIATNNKYPVDITGGSTTVTFQTTEVNLVGSSPVQFRVGTGGGWQSFNGPMAMLPGDYNFRFGGSDGFIVAINVSGCSITQSVLLIRLKDSTGAGVPGGKAYLGVGGWPHIGDTDDNGVLVYFHDSLLGNMRIRMTAPDCGGTQTSQYQDIADNSVYDFHLIQAVIQLEDSSGNLTDGGVVRLGISGWPVIGTTGDSGTGTVHYEMFEGSYNFRMTYNGITEQKNGQDISSPVVFKTTQAVIQLEDSSGNLTDGGVVRLGISGWPVIGSTGDSGTGTVHYEMFEGGYNFRMTYNGITEQKNGQDISSPVVFEISP